jgi:hypothetical protein
MMDASDMYPDGFHPVAQDKTRDFNGTAKYHTRTQKPPKYYFVDFGISRRYDPAKDSPLEDPIIGGDKSVPEFQGDRAFERSDPFLTDVYYIGNMVRRDFLLVGVAIRLPFLGGADRHAIGTGIFYSPSTKTRVWVHDAVGRGYVSR